MSTRLTFRFATLVAMIALGVASAANVASADDDTLPAANKLAETILGAKLRVADGKIIISHVKRGGPADRAGIRPGDRVQSIEKHKVASIDDALKILKSLRPGDGAIMTVVPSAAPRQLYFAAPHQAAPTGRGMLGVTLNDVSGGVVAGQLSMGGPAIIAGLRTGDRIVSVDGNAVSNSTQLMQRIAGKSPGDRIDLVIQRSGWQRNIIVTLGAAGRVSGLQKMNVPPIGATAPPAPALTSTDQSDPDDQWVDEQEAEDISNVNERALNTDFD